MDFFKLCHTDPTGFNAGFGQSPFGNHMAVPPMPPLPTSNTNNTAPANVFAQMKAGTFANNTDPAPQPAGVLDPLVISIQATDFHD
jgi:actin cytoskeleton-regulatory complex protein SLA1